MGKCPQTAHRAPWVKVMREETVLPVANTAAAAAAGLAELERMLVTRMEEMVALEFKTTSLVHRPTMLAAVAAGRAMQWITPALAE